MSVGRPRWTSPSTSSIVCWTWDARATSASPDPDGVGGSAAAPMIRAPRCDALTSVARLVHRGQTSAPIEPEAILYHPLAQGLAGHPAPMNLSKLLSRQGRTEIGIALRDDRHGEIAHSLGQTVVAEATTPA